MATSRQEDVSRELTRLHRRLETIDRVIDALEHYDQHRPKIHILDREKSA
jgi:hypothetical protein